MQFASYCRVSGQFGDVVNRFQPFLVWSAVLGPRRKTKNCIALEVVSLAWTQSCGNRHK